MLQEKYCYFKLHRVCGLLNAVPIAIGTIAIGNADLTDFSMPHKCLPPHAACTNVARHVSTL